MFQRIIGLVICLVGWFVAVLSTQISSLGGELALAVGGLGIAAVGALAIVNGAHLKDAIWKA